MSAQKITRRELIRSAATVGAGGVLGAALASCQEVAAPPPATAGAESAVGAAADKRDINCVGIFPISGFIAADGIEMRNGVVMAIDEINEMGGLAGHQLKYIEVDDVDSVGDQVTTAFERAIDVEKADVIFSGYHLTSGPEFDICANSGTLYYNNNTQKAWTDLYASDPEKYWPIFQTTPTTNGTVAASPGI